MLARGLTAAVVAGFLAVPSGALAAPRQSPGASTTSLSASPSAVAGGQSSTLSGTAPSEAPAGASAELYASPYPFTEVTAVATTTTAADGSFSFTVTPDRNTKYTAAVSGVSSPAVTVLVTGHTITRVSALTLGRAKVLLVIFHPRDLKWGNRRVSWSFASGFGGRFRPAPVTRSVNLSPYAAVLFTTAALPAGRFRWRACLHAPEAQALAGPTLPGCSGRGYSGGGHLPVGFPGPVAIARAERYLRTRTGNTALAVVDSEGRMSGVNLNEQFITGSVVKAMLLVAYLRRLDALGQHYVDSHSNSILYPMINVSDNDAAEDCWEIVGNAGLYAVATAAGMTHFFIDTTATWGGSWGASLITAADQARFFFEMDSLIPQEFVGYANFLLSTIAGYESWGIPAIARPLGYTVYFKAGWRPSPDVFLVHQIARLVGHRHTFAMAVMTDGDPDMSYGIDTIQGATAALLG